MGDGDPVLNEDDAWRQVYLALTSGYVLSDVGGDSGYAGAVRSRRFITAEGARVRVDSRSGSSLDPLDLQYWAVEQWNQIGQWSLTTGFTCDRKDA